MYVSHFTLDQINRNSHSPYIQQRVDTNILNYLCQDQIAKVDITRHIVNSVRKRNKSFLPTHSHVKWAMQCIGFAFSLPIQHHKIITQAIQIYSDWLSIGQKTDRPQCISQKQGFYQRQIMGHLSLIFSQRPGSTSKHASLCVEVLHILRDFVRSHPELQPQTWDTLLKLLILMNKPVLKNISLAQQLCPLLWKTILQIWLRSNTRVQELWEDLFMSFGSWLNQMQLIYQWSAVCQGLTSRVISMLYGEDSPTLHLHFPVLPSPHQEPAQTVSLHISLEQVLFYWFKYLNLLLQNTKDTIPGDPVVYRDLVDAVSNITDAFLAVAKKRTIPRPLEMPTFIGSNSSEALYDLTKKIQDTHFHYILGIYKLPIPNIDGLLALFGNWLFFHAGTEGSYNEWGRSKAVGALCRIFCKGGRPANDEYIGRFYKIVFKCMDRMQNSMIIVDLVKFSTKLLTVDHRGVRGLMHNDALIKALSEFLCQKDSAAVIKKPCYLILTSFVALAHYLNTDILINKVAEILHDCLNFQNTKNQSDHDNFHLLVWSGVVFISSIHSNQQMLEGLIQALVCHFDKLNLVQDKESCQVLLDALGSLPFLIYQKSIVQISIVKFVIKKLCHYIQGTLDKTSAERVIKSLLIGVLHWFMCFPEALNDDQLRLDAIQVILKISKKERVKNQAFYVKDYIINHLGRKIQYVNYTDLNNTEISSGNFSYREIDLPVKHFYLSWKSLLSMYDISSLNAHHEEVLLVIRNLLGKYTWKSQLVYRPSYVQPQSPVWKMEVQPDRHPAFQPQSDPQIQQQLLSDLSYQQVQTLKKIQQNIQQQKVNCAAHIKSKETKEEKPLKSFQQIDTDKPKSFRLLLSQLGLFHIDQLKYIKAVRGQEIDTLLKEFDQIPQKELLVVPVLYVLTPESKQQEILVNSQYYSQQFLQILPQLGTLISDQHTQLQIFRHVSKLITKYGGLIYNTGYYYEIAFLAPPVLTDPGKSSIKELVTMGHVVVMWNQRANDPISSKAPSILENASLLMKTVIVLTPLRNNIIKVNIWPKKKKSKFLDRVRQIGKRVHYGTEKAKHDQDLNQPGPLLNNMLIPSYLLGRLLIRTVLNMNGNSTTRISSRERRSECLEKIGELGARQEMNSRARLSSMMSYVFN